MPEALDGVFALLDAARAQYDEYSEGALPAVDDLLDALSVLRSSSPDTTEAVAEKWHCDRCSSDRWVSVSLDEGTTRRRQCVPCGFVATEAVTEPDAGSKG